MKGRRAYSEGPSFLCDGYYAPVMLMLTLIVLCLSQRHNHDSTSRKYLTLEQTDRQTDRDRDARGRFNVIDTDWNSPKRVQMRRGLAPVVTDTDRTDRHRPTGFG